MLQYLDQHNIIDKTRVNTPLHISLGFDKATPSCSTASPHQDDRFQEPTNVKHISCISFYCLIKLPQKKLPNRRDKPSLVFPELACTKVLHPCIFLSCHTILPGCLMLQQPRCSKIEFRNEVTTPFKRRLTTLTVTNLFMLDSSISSKLFSLEVQ